MKVINASKNVTIALNLREARGFFPRLKGLIGRVCLEEDEGLWMARCKAIHTFGMRFQIDVVFLDKDFIVKKIVKDLRPFSPFVFCWSAKGVLELPVCTIEKAKVEVGDLIEITL